MNRASGHCFILQILMLCQGAEGSRQDEDEEVRSLTSESGRCTMLSGVLQTPGTA